MQTKVFKVFGAHAGFMSFILGVTLLASLTFTEVTCPVSKGTGVLPGAQDLDATIVESELVSQELVSLECGWGFERYTYNVKLLVVNETTSAQYGMVMVTFYDPAQTSTRIVDVDDAEVKKEESLGPVVVAFPIFVEVAAGTTQTIEETLLFDGLSLSVEFGFDTGNAHTILVSTAGEFVCPYDGGTGKVSITEWLRLI